MDSSIEKHVLKRGYDIPYEGEAQAQIVNVAVSRFAVQPPNYRGIAPIPKLLVEIGDKVRAGDALFYDKSNPEIKYVSPVSGELIEVNRGDRRAIVELVILADKQVEFKPVEVPDLDAVNTGELRQFFKSSGLWPLINQRPFDIIAEDIDPKNIFISTFDSAPLAPDLNLVVAGNEAAFQKGLDVLAKMTTGKIYLGVDGRKGKQPADIFLQAKGVEKHSFSGPHPCGNVGIQIHHIAPIGLKDKVWTLRVQDVITIGRMWLENKYNTERIIALTGTEIDKRHYVKTFAGANIGDLLKGQTVNDNSRIISGNLLTGKTKTKEQYLDADSMQITVIKEGNTYRMFGWLSPLSPSPTVSKSFLNGWFSSKMTPQTNTNGEERAFVVSGQYERVLPMDIYPQHLIKSILANDIERMEGLGIFELSEEDLALCEYVCTSKINVQQILRQGLDLMREQG